MTELKTLPGLAAADADSRRHGPCRGDANQSAQDDVIQHGAEGCIGAPQSQSGGASGANTNPLPIPEEEVNLLAQSQAKYSRAVAVSYQVTERLVKLQGGLGKSRENHAGHEMR